MNDLANYLSFLWFLLSNVIPYTVRELVSIAMEYPLLFIIPMAFVIAVYIAIRVMFRMIRFMIAVGACSAGVIFVAYKLLPRLLGV